MPRIRVKADGWVGNVSRVDAEEWIRDGRAELWSGDAPAPQEAGAPDPQTEGGVKPPGSAGEGEGKTSGEGGGAPQGGGKTDGDGKPPEDPKAPPKPTKPADDKPSGKSRS